MPTSTRGLSAESAGIFLGLMHSTMSLIIHNLLTSWVKSAYPPPPLQDGMQIHCRVTPQCWIRQYLGGGSNEPLDPKASALTTRPPRLRWLHMRCLYFMQCEKYQKTSDGVQFVRPIPNAVLLPRRTQYGTAVARCLNLGWPAEFSLPRLLSTAGLAVPPAWL